MAKPPQNANPEQFIIGEGSYTNLRTAIPVDAKEEFRIDPSPLPLGWIGILNVIFAAMFAGFHWFLLKLGASSVEIGLPIFGIGAATCILFTVVTCWSFYRAQKHGPWMVVNKTNGRVELPREGVSFATDQVLHVQYITTKRLDWGGVSNNDRLSELNLLTVADGKRKRWPILRSILDDHAFDFITEPLMEATDLQVVRVVDEQFGWTVAETPLSD